MKLISHYKKIGYSINVLQETVAWGSTQSQFATLLPLKLQAGGSESRIYDGFGLKTNLLMRW